MKRIVLGVEYDGCGFHGWQTQPSKRGVQDALERVLTRIAHHPVATVCAGRTDSGVHASGQVVHFDTHSERPLTAWVRGSNALLPSGVAVLWSQSVPAPDREQGDDERGFFHARFSALTRCYRYTLLNRSVRPAMLAGRIGWFHRRLDETAMEEGAQLLLGEHDFSVFRAAECQARSPVRNLLVSQVRRYGEIIELDFEANAFLHHMIRNMVGALIAIGKGQYPPSWILELLASRSRKMAPPTFMADGLSLVGVRYPECWGVPCDIPSDTSAMRRQTLDWTTGKDDR